MKRINISSIALTAFIIAACSPSKKSTTSANSTAPPATTAPASTVPAGPSLPRKSSDGIFNPGNEELTALQAKYSSVTMKTLTDGYAIYTGVCANCHKAKNIYWIPEEAWPAIIDRMAPMARITEVEKDAVFKYVMAIKATQPK